MVIQLRAGWGCRTHYGSDLLDDTPECVEKFENMRKKHPEYQLTDGDGMGRTVLMVAVGRGNVTMVKHLVKLMDETQINEWNGSGYTIFENVTNSFLHPKRIQKIVECVKIVLEAGGDINLANAKEVAPLDALILHIPDSIHGDCALPLIKLYIRAGAHAPTGRNSTFPMYLQAQEEIAQEDWLKTRNIYIGSRDAGSAFYLLPLDIQHLITQAFNALPDIAQPPQSN